MELHQGLIASAWVGIGATAVLDLWLILLRRLGVPVQGFALIGRWVGHLSRGKLTHAGIAKSPHIPGELALGWLTHYATGIAFAGILLALQGPAWIAAPTLVPALALGVSTVLLPLFLMQPAMGAGFASSNTPTPLRNCLRSLSNHTVFGLGLYLAASLFAAISPFGGIN